LEFFGNLKFDEIWPTNSLLHLVLRKNKSPASVDKKFEFPLNVKFGLIYR
jgi:hypothetical protein